MAGKSFEYQTVADVVVESDAAASAEKAEAELQQMLEHICPGARVNEYIDAERDVAVAAENTQDDWELHLQADFDACRADQHDAGEDDVECLDEVAAADDQRPEKLLSVQHICEALQELSLPIRTKFAGEYEAFEAVQNRIVAKAAQNAVTKKQTLITDFFLVVVPEKVSFFSYAALNFF